MRIERAAKVAVEVAHRSVTGALHGHSLTVEAITDNDVDLDAWQHRVGSVVAFMENGLLEDIVGRTFEDVARRVLDELPEADTVIVRLPSRGHTIMMTR